MMKKSISCLLSAATLLIGLASCGAEVPSEYEEGGRTVAVTPDYTGVTIPCNIAPLNFRIGIEGDDYVTRLRTKANPEGIVVSGRDLDIPVDEWHDLIGKAKGDSVYTDIFVRRNGKWKRYSTEPNAIADSIDPYISYRLIEPSYIGFETMAICQRNLTDFDESEIFNSQSLSESGNGQCINCHSYQDYNRGERMQMHVRGRLGGTVIACGDILTKVTLKTPATISNGVYPSWHPTLPLIAYSVNETSQSFHSRDRNKVEVQDGASDLVLYDVEKNSVRIIANDSTELETFPYWHPDGRSLWYVSAKVPAMSPDEMKVYENTNYEDFKYDIYRKPFDPATRTFGRTDTVLRVSGQGKSATLPRPSPDGRYLLFTAGSYGTFHIWHRDADLYLLDIATKAVRPLSEVNSPDVESYHSWSSNGHWIIFSSRRDDGSYTRLYIAYFDRNGKARKPFRLPQATPDYDDNRMKSYNIPEFMARPVSISKKELEDAIQGEILKAAIEARTAEVNEAR